ncbi:TPA: site-specific integrase, partial [Pseudomonas aeruginosa]|nr:site-specific integrase [Pseudomonas aeruginosa]
MCCGVWKYDGIDRGLPRGESAELALEKRAFSNLSVSGAQNGRFFRYAGGQCDDREGGSLSAGRPAREYPASLSAGARAFRGHLGRLLALLQCRRDRALILLGFWRAFRSDDLCRLRVEFVQARPGEGMELFLPSGKGDRDNRGRSFSVPALTRLCPVEAYLDWIAASGLRQGPVFRAVDRWGNLAEEGLHAYSVSRILRRVMLCSGLESERFSSHSLRRGFATWASRNQWSAKALMSYVGWRDAKAALRY